MCVCGIKYCNLTFINGTTNNEVEKLTKEIEQKTGGKIDHKKVSDVTVRIHSRLSWSSGI